MCTSALPPIFSTPNLATASARARRSCSSGERCCSVTKVFVAMSGVEVVVASWSTPSSDPTSTVPRFLLQPMSASDSSSLQDRRPALDSFELFLERDAAPVLMAAGADRLVALDAHREVLSDRLLVHRVAVAASERLELDDTLVREDLDEPARTVLPHAAPLLTAGSRR